MSEITWFKAGLDETEEKKYTDEFTHAQIDWLFDDEDDVSITSSNINDNVENEEMMVYDPLDQRGLVNSESYKNMMTHEFSVQISYAVQILKLASWYLKHKIAALYPTPNVLKLIQIIPTVVNMFYKLNITQIDAFLQNVKKHNSMSNLFEIRYPNLLNKTQQYKFHVILHFCLMNFTVGDGYKFDKDFLSMFFNIIEVLFCWVKFITMDDSFHERACLWNINNLESKYFDIVHLLSAMIMKPYFNHEGTLRFGTNQEYDLLCESIII